MLAADLLDRPPARPRRQHRPRRSDAFVLLHERPDLAGRLRAGRAGDPLYRARRPLHTGADLLTDRQRQRLTLLFDVEDHVQVEATWGIYQRMIAAYREPDRAKGRQLMRR